MLKARYATEFERINELKLKYSADLEHPVFGEGCEVSPLIMFIGEAPGREEAECGRPFVGKAGKQLDEMLDLAGIKREEAFVTNAVKYRPTNIKNGRASNRTPTEPEIVDGLSLLKFEIETVDPVIIATLGNVPLSAVSRLIRGRIDPMKVGERHGCAMQAAIGGAVRRLFPLYHPAACIYRRELRPVLEKDLKALGRYAEELRSRI